VFLLKCDIVRPCTLCARSGFECTPINNASIPVQDPVETQNKRQRGSNYMQNQQQAVTIPSPNSQLPNQIFGDSTLPSSEESSDAERTQKTGTPKLGGLTDPCIQVIGSPSTVRLFRRPSGGIFFPILTLKKLLTSCENSRNAFAGDSSAMGLTKQGSIPLRRICQRLTPYCRYSVSTTLSTILRLRHSLVGQSSDRTITPIPSLRISLCHELTWLKH
jgi:hypothetical protein